MTPGLAGEVLAFAQPGRPTGLFGRMLGAEGQVENETVDVAGVFLEALAECVDKGIVRVNTRANGHVFVTSEFWLLTTPKGIDCVKDFLRTRREGRRYDFSRGEIFRALLSEGCLADGGAVGVENASWICGLDVIGWDKPLELYGLPILVEALPAQPRGVLEFDGTVTLKKEKCGWKR